MFKKTLLAATVALVSTGAMAIDVDTGTTGLTYGAEALSSGKVKNDFSLTLPAVVLTLGAEYSVGDIIKVSMDGAEFKTTDSFALAASGTVGDLTVGFLSATANELVFRVTAVQNTATTGKTLTLAAGTKAKFSSTAVGAKVSVTANAETSTGIAIDVKGKLDTVVAGTVIQQHKFATTTALSENIDVADERKALTALSDTAVVTYTEVVPTFAATDFDASAANAINFTVNGSFTGFETGVTGSTNLGTVVIDTVAATVAADLQSGEADLPATTTSDTMNIVFTPDAAATTRVVLNAGSYTLDAELTDGTFKTSVTGLALGSFTLNGASNVYAYVPVNYDGAVTTQFEIGNKGKVDGEITLTAFDTDGNTYSATLEKKAEAGKLTKLSDADISTAFGLTKGTKLNLTITVNAPDADITMGAYSNRGTTGRMAINKV